MPNRGPKPRKPHAAPAPDGWDPPANLTAAAAAEWTHLVGQLAAAGNLERTDRSLVKAYAVCAAMLDQAHEALATDGAFTLNGAGCATAHPACAVINAATMRLKALCDSLGLSPSASKHAAGSHAAKPASKWGGLFTG